MTLLLPLGLLALLSVLIWLVIYLIKPNYQQKFISSTFVWKLSLKYRRRRIPTSKLRNFFLILCQILILVLGAFIIAQPGTLKKETVKQNETIAIIDASASMRSVFNDGETRFDRAVQKTLDITEQTVLHDGGLISIIVADKDPYYLVERADDQQLEDIYESLGDLECSYGVSDLDAAVGLCDSVFEKNPSAKIVVYTGTEYAAVSQNITVDNVAVDGEWNIAILDATAELVDNFYTITINVASYGADEDFKVYCDVIGVNGTTENKRLPTQTVYGAGDKTVSIVYTAEDRSYGLNSIPVLLEDEDRIWSFREIFVHIDVMDCIVFDNEYYVYSGDKQKVRIQYYSTLSNDFFTNALNILCSGGVRQDRWDFDLQIVRKGEPELSGFDIYIFEHSVPATLPTDGIVFLADPDKSAGAGFTVGRKVTVRDWSDGGATLTKGMEHPLTDYINVTNLRLTQYTMINENTLDGYKTLMYFNGSPVYFVKEDGNRKIVVMAFSLHYSTAALTIHFPMLLLNLFNYFERVTFDKFVYDVYDTVALDARGADLTVRTVAGKEYIYGNVPAKMTVDLPGTYICSQQLMSGKLCEEKFYVRVDPALSNICLKAESLRAPVPEKKKAGAFSDWLLYLAIAIVALLFIEWELHVFDGN